MKTEALKSNKTLRTGVILAVIAVITLVALAMTFSKYAVQGTGEDSARIAKWGLNSAIDNNIDLFDNQYNGTGSRATIVTVDASDGSNVVAPGTSKEKNITLATFNNNQAPEVMYHFEPSLEITDGYVAGGQSLIDKLDKLPGWYWTLGTNGDASISYPTVATLKAAVAALQQTDIAPNTMPKTQTIQLGWTWVYEKGYDSNDTELGNLIAQGALSGLTVTLNLNAYQCQGCGTESKYKPIQRTLTFPDSNESKTVNFLPSYSGDKCPDDFEFYVKDSATGEYNKLTDVTGGGTVGSMSDLCSRINRVSDPSIIYTTATTGTFYTFIDRRWDKVFNGIDDSGSTTGLSDSMKYMLRGGKDTGNYVYKTVYYENNDDTTTTNIGNWDNHLEASSEPELNKVGYTKFYSAYQNLMITNIPAFGSHGDSLSPTYALPDYWNNEQNSWGRTTFDANLAIVISVDF